MGKMHQICAREKQREKKRPLLFVYAVISHDHAPNNIKRNYLREDVSNDTNTTTSATIDPIFKSIAISRL